MYYVYILDKDRRFYIGYTKDLRRRIAEDKKGGKIKLLYYEAYVSENVAKNREKN